MDNEYEFLNDMVNEEDLLTEEEDLLEDINEDEFEHIRKKYQTSETPKWYGKNDSSQIDSTSAASVELDPRGSKNGNLKSGFQDYVNATLQEALVEKFIKSQDMKMAHNYKDGNFKDIIESYLPDGQLSVPTNVLKTFTNVKKATILDSHAEIRVKPISLDSLMPIETADAMSADGDIANVMDMTKLDVIQNWVDMQWNKNSMKEAMQLITDDVIVKGVGFALIEYDNQALNGIDMNKTSGEVGISILDPISVIPDPRAILHDLSDAKFVYIYNEINIEDLRSRPGYDAISDKVDKLYKDGSFSDPRNSDLQAPDVKASARTSSYANQTIPYFALYRKIYDEQNERFVILFSEFVGETCWFSLQENVPLNIDEIPIAVFKSEINAPTLFPQSPVMQVIPIQLALALLDSITVNAALTSAFPLLVADQSTGLTNESLALIQTQGTGSGALINVDKSGNIHNAIGYVQREIPDTLPNLVDNLKKSIQEMIGITKLDTGDSGSVQTGDAMSILNTNSEKADKVLLEGYSLFKTRIAKLMVKTMLANFDERQLALGQFDSNGEDVYNFPMFHPEQFAGINVDFFVDGEVYTETQWMQRKQEMIQLYQTQGTLGFVEVPLITEGEFVDLLDLPNKEMYRLREAQNKARVKELKAQVLVELSNKYALVWQIVNQIYEGINGLVAPQRINPFTPISALPEQLQMQVVQQVQLAFIKVPFLAQQLDFNMVALFLDQDLFGQAQVQVAGMNKTEILKQELQMLQPTDPSGLAQQYANGMGQPGQLQEGQNEIAGRASAQDSMSNQQVAQQAMQGAQQPQIDAQGGNVQIPQ